MEINHGFDGRETEAAAGIAARASKWIKTVRQRLSIHPRTIVPYLQARMAKRIPVDANGHFAALIHRSSRVLNNIEQRRPQKIPVALNINLSGVEEADEYVLQRWHLPPKQ